MKRGIKLANLTVGQLLELYTELGLAQYAAENRGKLAQFNRLAKKGFDVVDELERRPGDQRLALRQLYDHPNMRVKYNAARDTWFASNIDSRRKLEEIRDSKWQPYCAEAAMQIRILDGTACKPDHDSSR
ncbi:MAG: DUF2019 domain-containing protein [Pseudomonadota bacterium]